ncbi:hypothetical protein CDAR_71311 [Caerostris darwini]|uniref:Uncharacterized protein n=1 Tax=Caerostris darwini TaxID=1538125 RepID=A0AAV4WE56_9ARAC|nr:hypothetical protein CDAR_71311 [Caerostris darwini]
MINGSLEYTQKKRLVLPSHFQRRDVICWHAPSAGVPEIAPRAVPRRSVIRCTTHLGFSVAEEPRCSKRMHSSHGPAIDTCLSQANGCTEHERQMLSTFEEYHEKQFK